MKGSYLLIRLIPVLPSVCVYLHHPYGLLTHVSRRFAIHWVLIKDKYINLIYDWIPQAALLTSQDSFVQLHKLFAVIPKDTFVKLQALQATRNNPLVLQLVLTQSY